MVQTVPELISRYKASLALSSLQDEVYKWVFLKEFQGKVIKSLKDRKPIKLDSLYKHLSKKCGYSPEQIKNFFEAIDIKIYHPLVLGKVSSLALS